MKTTINDGPKPILSLADSQLLFKKNNTGEFVLNKIKDWVDPSNCKAVYLGASNGDLPEFFEIFQMAMVNFGVQNCTHISGDFTDDELDKISGADLVLLSGGDTYKGFKKMEAKGVDKLIQEKYQSGAFIVGVSAGAVQFGWEFTIKNGEQIIPGIKLLPFNVGVHEEANEWNELKILCESSANMNRAVGIPFGGGFYYYPDNTLEAIERPLEEFLYVNKKIKETLIY